MNLNKRYTKLRLRSVSKIPVYYRRIPKVVKLQILKPIQLGEIEKTEEENKDQLNITSSHQHELENELKDTMQKVS